MSTTKEKLSPAAIALIASLLGAGGSGYYVDQKASNKIAVLESKVATMESNKFDRRITRLEVLVEKLEGVVKVSEWLAKLGSNQP